MKSTLIFQLLILPLLYISGYEGIIQHLRRSLIGSNCIMIENGRIPPYEKCLGCEILEAMNCVDDMRNNITGNVPPGCNIRAINVNYDESCCPKYGLKQKNKYFESSAYPGALSCLRRVGCRDTEIYEQLLNECLRVCSADANIAFDDPLFTCTAQADPGFSLQANVFLGTICSIVLLKMFLLE